MAIIGIFAVAFTVFVTSFSEQVESVPLLSDCKPLTEKDAIGQWGEIEYIEGWEICTTIRIIK